MKWLRMLCSCVAFFVALTPSSSYSRTVQPVTYLYTTTNDGEHTKAYQDGTHRVYNQHTTPCSRHPSILTHHYFDRPVIENSSKFVHAVATKPPTSPTSNQTHNTPRKKNDYVAKVSYVRGPESVSLATTIEEKGTKQPSAEPPMRKLVVVTKRRPLKPVAVIPVQEQNENDDYQVGNFRRNINTKSAHALVAETPPAYTSPSQNKINGGGTDNGHEPHAINAHRVRKIRLKPTTTSTSTSTSKPSSTSSTTNLSMWENVLHEPINTTVKRVKQSRTKSIVRNKIISPTLPPSAFNYEKASLESALPDSSANNRELMRVRPMSTSTSPKPTTTEYTLNKEINNLIDHDTEITHFTKEESKPQQGFSNQYVVGDTEDEAERDGGTLGAYEDLEYPDEYDDYTETQSMENDGGDEEWEENTEHMSESPVKMLRKPLRYSYSTSDQKPAATDDERENTGREASAMKKVSGDEHLRNSHQREGDKGDAAYVARQMKDHSKKGFQDEKNHKNYYAEQNGHKKKDHEEHGHLKEHEIKTGGKKATEYKESGKHQKGHSTKGSHNVHKKNEYMKKHEFYDEHHEGDSHEKYNDYVKGHKHKHGGDLKHAHKDEDSSEGSKAKKGKHQGGHHLHKDLHHMDDHGFNNHYGDMKNYHDGDSSSEDKKWKYMKANDFEDEHETE